MKEILDIIHNTIYQFFDVCGDDEETPMSDKDKLLLEVNKAICNNLKALEQDPCEDAISRQAVLDTFGLSEKTRKYGGDHSGYDTIMLYEVQDAIEALPPVNPLSVFDDIKEKLQRLADDEWNQNVGNCAQGLSDAIEIIDECIGKAWE